MSMSGEHFELYCRCFPQYKVTEETFSELAFSDCAEITEKRICGKLAGYVIVSGSSVSLLCVDEKHRNRGIGGELLRAAENTIAESGADTILLGRGNNYIFQGVPADIPSSVRFFEKRGYSADWTSVNMRLSLDTFDPGKLSIPPCPENITFRLALPEELPLLHDAVRSADESWVKYFDRNDHVLLALSDGKIVGFEMLSRSDCRFVLDGQITGSVGCVGVIPEARRRGIGLRMVAEGARRLKSMGCTSIELLYVELTDWYARLGFEIVHHQWMGEKKF